MAKKQMKGKGEPNVSVWSAGDVCITSNSMQWGHLHKTDRFICVCLGFRSRSLDMVHTGRYSRQTTVHGCRLAPVCNRKGRIAWRGKDDWSTLQMFTAFFHFQDVTFFLVSLHKGTLPNNVRPAPLDHQTVCWFLHGWKVQRVLQKEHQSWPTGLLPLTNFFSVYFFL